MPIQPKPLMETEPVSVRFPRPLLESLDAYCRHLGGASDRSYVIVEAVREVLARDRGFQKAQRGGNGKPPAAEPVPEKKKPHPAPAGAAREGAA